MVLQICPRFVEAVVTVPAVDKDNQVVSPVAEETRPAAANICIEQSRGLFRQAEAVRLLRRNRREQRAAERQHDAHRRIGEQISVEGPSVARKKRFDVIFFLDIKAGEMRRVGFGGCLQAVEGSLAAVIRRGSAGEAVADGVGAETRCRQLIGETEIRLIGLCMGELRAT